MSAKNKTIHIVGAGLAGTECALQLAERGYSIVLYEMRLGSRATPAHKTKDFAELVCSNSFGSVSDTSASGLLKWEAQQLGSYILKSALDARVPAGQALGIDRELFARNLTEQVQAHPMIEVRDEVVTDLANVPRPCVMATGPLTDESLAKSMMEHFGDEFLYFFDAIAPIIDADTINTSIAWKGDRFNKGTENGVGDYFNCPMDKEQYQKFHAAIMAARKIEPKDFEITPYFESCLPIEEIARRGEETLRFGPMSSKGLWNPHVGNRPYAVVQLRQDNQQATAYNMVGFQTKMAYPDQKEVFRTIPGLEHAEFLKLGSIHRNLYINSPKRLTPFLQSRSDENLFFAGQITGVEGYFDSTCMGLLVALFLDQKLSGQEMRQPPRETALGSLLHAITQEVKPNFQPTNINFALLPVPPVGMPRHEKKVHQVAKARAALVGWRNELGLRERKNELPVVVQQPLIKEPMQVFA